MHRLSTNLLISNVFILLRFNLVDVEDSIFVLLVYLRLHLAIIVEIPLVFEMDLVVLMLMLGKHTLPLDLRFVFLSLEQLKIDIL